MLAQRKGDKICAHQVIDHAFDKGNLILMDNQNRILCIDDESHNLEALEDERDYQKRELF